MDESSAVASVNSVEVGGLEGKVDTAGEDAVDATAVAEGESDEEL